MDWKEAPKAEPKLDGVLNLPEYHDSPQFRPRSENMSSSYSSGMEGICAGFAVVVCNTVDHGKASPSMCGV